MWKEAVVAYLKSYPDISLEKYKETSVKKIVRVRQSCEPGTSDKLPPGSTRSVTQQVPVQMSAWLNTTKLHL
jgi:hypothetical protein